MWPPKWWEHPSNSQCSTLQELLSILEPSVAEVTSCRSIQLNVGAKRVSLTCWFGFWVWVWDILVLGLRHSYFCTQKNARFHCQHCQKNLGIEALSKDSSRIWKARFLSCKTWKPEKYSTAQWGWLSISVWRTSWASLLCSLVLTLSTQGSQSPHMLLENENIYRGTWELCCQDGHTHSPREVDQKYLEILKQDETSGRWTDARW